jgi:hypothetical protein
MLPQVFRSGAEALAIATVLYSSVALGAQDDTTDKVDILDYVDPLIGTANGGALSELSAAPMK